MIARLRFALAAVALVVWTLALAPFQWIGLRVWPTLAARVPVLYHRGVCRLLGVRVTQVGRPSRMRPLLIVANHVTWLDIVVLSACAPVSFIAKREMITWPVFGWLARAQRTIFVDRTDRRGAMDQARAIEERLSDGDLMVLFPEGTTSDGNRVLPFNPTLLAAPTSLAKAGETVSVQPVALDYVRHQGLPLTRSAMPLVGWPGEVAIGPSLTGVLMEAAIDVDVHWLAPITVAPDTRRRDIARTAHDAIRAARTLNASAAGGG